MNVMGHSLVGGNHTFSELWKVLESSSRYGEVQV